ncbi:response regulator [Corynebacterium doosanense]|uniref:LuxR family transcriptional regulator n=1 Tax=Corynebacterium doosanense CAU 212 = DSM 45436 TaxID=558173 RepID=A0A097IFB2_9CORY|nr:response regulator transcription factor [Corynebacterium doosanense]AIT60818.1 LuxR family transcriptional regulator [Corynebacterium doosanense CAU 212 = DSM 45436]
MDEVIRLVIADDEALVRSGLRLLLDGTRGIRVVGEAADGAEAAEKARSLRADVALMDLRMPGTSGIEGALLIGGDSTVLMLTSFDSEGDVVAAFDAGAKGFLLKSAPPEQLVDAVLTAARGQAAMSEKVLGTLVSMAGRTVARDPGSPVGTLSDREFTVAALIAEGLSNEEIAERIFVALPTVKTLVSRIMKKLGATNRVQVAVAYLTSG